jgi:hypothetical protein
MTAETMTALPGELRYIQYEHALEEQYLPAIRTLISKDLSEPYSIYVYRYFLYQWAHLCFMVRSPSPSPRMFTNALQPKSLVPADRRRLSRPSTPRTTPSSASLSASWSTTPRTPLPPTEDTLPCWLWRPTTVETA